MVGAGLIVAGQFGLVLPDSVSDDVATIFDSAVALLTAFGVYRVPNNPAPLGERVAKPAPGFGPDGIHRI